MSISLHKVESLIEDKGFVVKALYYTHHAEPPSDQVKWIKIVSCKTGDEFILKIPGTYDLRIEQLQDNHIPLTRCNLPSELDHSNSLWYVDPEIDHKQLRGYTDSKNPLEGYSQSEPPTENSFHHAYRQIHRLSLSAPCELAVVKNGYITSTSGKEKHCFKWDPTNREQEFVPFTFYICFGLEEFYEKDILSTVSSTYETLYKILDQNAASLSAKLDRTSTWTSRHRHAVDTLGKKKKILLGVLSQLQTLLQTIQPVQKETRKQLAQTEQDIVSRGLTEAAGHVFKKEELQKELEKLETVQLNSTEKIIQIRHSLHLIMLTVDTFLFDTLLLLHTVKQHLESLVGFQSFLDGLWKQGD